MTTALFKMFGALIIAQACIFTGLFFIGGQVFPQHLAKVYAATGYFSRTVIASATLLLLANLLNGWALGNIPPAISAPSMVAVYVLMMCAGTMLATGAKPSLLLLPAIALTMAGAVWVSILLRQG